MHARVDIHSTALVLNLTVQNKAYKLSVFFMCQTSSQSVYTVNLAMLVISAGMDWSTEQKILHAPLLTHS